MALFAILFTFITNLFAFFAIYLTNMVNYFSCDIIHLLSDVVDINVGCR